MGQLLEVTAKPFKAIHFRLNGRLVPDDRLVLVLSAIFSSPS